MSFNPPFKDWHGKVVWLVGASSGIGQATATALYEQGATVYVSGRNAQALEEWVSAHPEQDSLGHQRANALPLDVNHPEAVHLAARSIATIHPLDLVMYCAGYYKDLRATDFSLGEMLKHQEVNYVGALHVLDAVLPMMLERARAPGAQAAGHISLVSSVAGFRGLPNSLAYGPTKAALINLAEALYLDLSPLRIGVSVINPGFVETPLTAQNKFTMPALISPEQAADSILDGWRKGLFEIHFPKRFTRWLKLLRLLPYRWYFPLIRKFTGL